MRIHLTPRKRGRRLAGAAVAMSALAMMLGLIPSASAHTVARAAPAAPTSSRCLFAPTPAQFWVLDPAATPVGLIHGNYNRRGEKGVAYKVTGQFTHSTTMVFTSYNNLENIVGPGYSLNDAKIIPDPGSVNPFVPGTRVEGTPRNFTAWFWPDDTPVPAGLQNVVLYPTKPENPGGTARWTMTLRMYKTQPGFSALAALRAMKITAVSAANPSTAVRCPLTVAGTLASQIAALFAHKSVYGTINKIPEPATGNKLYFTRFPTALGAGLDGYPGPVVNSCAQYLTTHTPLNMISVTDLHKVAPYFNNDLVTPASVMKDYPIRYQSFTISLFTTNTRLYKSVSVNTDNAVYTSDGSFVTVWLPSDPKLSTSQIAQVRNIAAANNFNVIQLAPPAKGPLSKQIPDGWLVWRQKGISSSFPFSNTNVPCWATNHNYKTWGDQTSPAFFAKYASNPRNMGPYYGDGVKLNFAQFISRYSK